MKILVTGGAGFIGSNFIRYILKNKEIEIINLDKLTYAGNRENLTDIEDDNNYRFIKGDICNQSLVNKIVSDNVDIIINFAAESHVDRSIEDPNKFFNTNVLGTQILLDAAVKYEVDKFIQISTDEV
ncbi:MAG TPA: GDP-mannose 4,6-dehydratase, partial [Halanaerobiales bacterium]|nr:GDP-mannose 4,6-dehydratase [Halanaerobiales bacterium]